MTRNWVKSCQIEGELLVWSDFSKLQLEIDCVEIERQQRLECRLMHFRGPLVQRDNWVGLEEGVMLMFLVRTPY